VSSRGYCSVRNGCGHVLLFRQPHTAGIVSAKDCAAFDVGGREPFAERFDRASIAVFAEDDRDLFAGLLLIGF